MKLYYYHNEEIKKQLNSCGKDYTSANIPMLLKSLGFTAEEFNPDQLKSNQLASDDIILIGADKLSEQEVDALAGAAKKGCKVIGFATEAKSFFPECKPVCCSDDIFDVVGYFSFKDKSEPLLVLHKFDTFSADCGEVLGTFEAKDGAEYPALVKISDGVFYFSFDIPGTLWHAADGRPTIEPQNGFFCGRIPDGEVTESDWDGSIAYGDCYMQFVSDLLVSYGIPKIYTLPVEKGKVADLLLYFGGDSDANTAEECMQAARSMYDRGLPYHINVMPQNPENGFLLNKEDFDKLHEIGCETAIHYNFWDFPYSEEGFKMQADMYRETFDEVSVGPVHHCLIQIGSPAKRLRLQAEHGALGNNDRFSSKTNPENINAFNIQGYIYGSAFPRFALDDAEHENKDLSFCEVPSCYYEPRFFECSDEEKKHMEAYLDEGVAKGRLLELFYHPHYLVYEPAALRALDYALEYISSKGWNAAYAGSDGPIFWWFDRAKCSIEDIAENGFTFQNPTDRQMVIVLPCDSAEVSVNGVTKQPEVKNINGKDIKLLILDPGCSVVRY